LSIEIAMSTLDYLTNERDYVPWVAAIRQIQYLDTLLQKTDVYADFKVHTNAHI